jgi:hypothetical protein
MHLSRRWTVKHRWKAVGVLVALGGCVRGGDVPRTDLEPTGGASLESEAPAADTHVEDATAPSDAKPRPDEPTPHEEPELVERCARLRSLPTWCAEPERARVRKRGTP